VLLSEVFDTQCIKLNLKGRTKDEVFAELIETIAAVHPELNRKEMLAAINERENQPTPPQSSGVWLFS
jgi:mannitol/fructose-specific phosphotransferase system IIA component (Ntr-type)